MRAEGSRILFLWSELFWSHQNSILCLLMWYDDWSGLHKKVLAFTDGKCQKGEKDKGQEVSKTNWFWNFLTFNTWRQWLIFLERFSSVLPEMFRCFFCDISLSTNISTFRTRKKKWLLKWLFLPYQFHIRNKGNLDFISDELVKIKV